MSKAIVIYHSESGNTEKMALAIGDGLKNAGLETGVKSIDDATLEDLVAADAIILGCPTYWSGMTAKMKAFVENAVNLWPGKPGQLKDKIGAAFTSCAGVDGGNETTLLSLIQAMLWHGMIIVGHQNGPRGAVSNGEPNAECLTGCREFGKRIGMFTPR